MPILYIRGHYPLMMGKIHRHTLFCLQKGFKNFITSCQEFKTQRSEFQVSPEKQQDWSHCAHIPVRYSPHYILIHSYVAYFTHLHYLPDTQAFKLVILALCDGTKSLLPRSLPL